MRSGVRRNRRLGGLSGDGRFGHRISRLIESSFGPRDLSPYRGTGSGRAVSRYAFSAVALALKGREVRERTSGTRPRRQLRGIRAM